MFLQLGLKILRQLGVLCNMNIIDSIDILESHILYKFAICVVAKVLSVGIVMQQIIFIVTNVSAVARENPSSVGSVMQYEYYTHYRYFRVQYIIQVCHSCSCKSSVSWEGYATNHLYIHKCFSSCWWKSFVSWECYAIWVLYTV